MATLLRLGLPKGTKRRLTAKLAPRPPAPTPVPLWPDIEAALHNALDPEVEALQAMVPGLDLAW